MRTNIKRIDMLKILLLAKFKDSKFCYIIILRVAKQDLYDVSYLKKRYRKIVAKNEKALFMADHECLKCVYFQRLARKCQANCKCPLEESTEGGVFT